MAFGALTNNVQPEEISRDIYEFLFGKMFEELRI